MTQIHRWLSKELTEAQTEGRFEAAKHLAQAKLELRRATEEASDV